MGASVLLVTQSKALPKYEKFDDKAFEALGFYVYALFDPEEPNFPFYVGKGKGNRVFAHASGRFDEIGEDALTTKQATIKRILLSGHVLHKVVQYGLKEKQALSVEAALIQMLNHIRPGLLSNQVDGHGQKMLDTRDLAVEMNATPLKIEGTTALILKIDEKWPRMLRAHENVSANISRELVFLEARGNWELSRVQAEGVKCVLVVARKIVREVFVPNGWENVLGTRRKRSDIPLIAMAAHDEDAARQYWHFKGTSVAHYFPRHAQNPIRYVRPAKS